MFLGAEIEKVTEIYPRDEVPPTFWDGGSGRFITDTPVGPDTAALGGPSSRVGNGFRSISWRIPEDEITIILINNNGEPSLATMAEGILDVLHGNEIAPKDPLPETSSVPSRGSGNRKNPVAPTGAGVTRGTR